MTNSSTATSLPPLRVDALVRTTLTTYRGHFARIAWTAVALYVPIGFLEAFVVDVGEGYYDRHDTFLAGLLLAFVIVVTSLSVSGDAFFAGFLDAAVGEEVHGQPRRTVPQILRTLPYRRLIVADFLLSFTIATGSLVFVVPGLVLFTLFCLIGPLINIEGLAVRQAFVRSFRLVRPVFWLTAVTVTLPILAEHELAHALQVWALGSYLLKALVDGVLAAIVYSLVGMLEVTLAYDLIRRDQPG